MSTKKLIENEIGQALQKQSDGSYKTLEVTLKEQQNAHVLTHFVVKSLIMEASKDTPIEAVDEKGMKFSNMLGGERESKQELGTGKFKKFTISKPITIDWEHPAIYRQGLPAYAKNTWPASVAAKLDKFLDQDSKFFERTGFERLEKAAKANKLTTPIKIDTEKAQGAELYNAIVSACDKLTELVDKTTGIDLIDKDKIIVFVRNDILTKISTYALTGNHASQSLSYGSYALGMLGGYQTFACPFLKETSVIITTTNSMGNGRKIIAAAAGKIDNLSEDLGAYLETTFVSDVILPNVPVAIIHETKNA
ncbi:HtpE [Mycoplasma phage MAV1]|uniref:Uncharacterized protein n=1 Tax=Metamycoplasma arthritidis (strain 158L3-1) TaxID=243272 RepID=B3PNB2_META1|nr:hypothetical protein [Metamycoplasma arthritidis]NP_047265.1 HtpE [Mycoplasma phage MAV1]AAC33775.1 HtpE [Mycoplasma phage MAV1]ACF07514.1 bacteriophage MAV1 hypothetical protein [Metamycoplasma arthritidis 158L3-1]